MAMSFLLVERCCILERRCLLLFVSKPISTFHVEHMCTRDFLVKRCFNIERRHRPRTAPKTHGIPQRLHEQEWAHTDVHA